MTDDLVNRLRDTACQGVELAIKNGRFVSPHEAADRIEKLEADNARLREALEGLKAAVDDLDNPFDASASGEMHYGFERAVDDATLVIEAALQETSHDA